MPEIDSNHAVDAADGPEICFVCEDPFILGDPVYYSDDGYMHAACCGPERDSFWAHDNPLKAGEPIPRPQIWSAEVAPMPDATDEVNDRVCVDRFAAEMKLKMARARDAGRGGWNDPSLCSMSALSEMLIAHVAKGDPVDVANFAMMIHQRGSRIEYPLVDTERLAKAIFDAMPYDGPIGTQRPDWIDGGNSLMQDQARRYATEALGIYPLSMDAFSRGASIPSVSSIEAEPGDRFVLRSATAMSEAMYARIQEAWARFAGPDVKLLVLDKGMELAVLRDAVEASSPSDANAEGEA